MSRELYQARQREISEELRRLADREASLVAEWHRLEYALTEGPQGDHALDDEDTLVDGIRLDDTFVGPGPVEPKKRG